MAFQGPFMSLPLYLPDLFRLTIKNVICCHHAVQVDALFFNNSTNVKESSLFLLVCALKNGIVSLEPNINTFLWCTVHHVCVTLFWLGCGISFNTQNWIFMGVAYLWLLFIVCSSCEKLLISPVKCLLLEIHNFRQPLVPQFSAPDTPFLWVVVDIWTCIMKCEKREHLLSDTGAVERREVSSLHVTCTCLVCVCVCVCFFMLAQQKLPLYHTVVVSKI